MLNPVAQEVERLLNELRTRLGFVESRLAAVEQNANKIWGSVGGGGGTSGGTGVYEVPGGVAIAAGGSATANVYYLAGGSSTLFVTGATIYNPYGVATTAGKTLTVGPNGDGTFTVLAQSC